MTRRAVALLVLAMFAAGCSQYRKEPEFQRSLNPQATLRPATYEGPDQWPPYSAIYTQRFVWKMQFIADQLYTKMSGLAPEKTSVLMTTLVPVENIYEPTSFGRLCSEQLMTELAKKGFGVIEARKAEGYLVRDNKGEFYLSRDTKRIAGEFSADVALVGTYAKSNNQVLINTRMVDTKDGKVLAAASAMMDLRGDKFLPLMFQEDRARAGSADGSGSVSLRKKVMPESDSYAEVMRLMVRDIAYKISSSTPAGEGERPVVAVATFVDVDNMRRAASFGRYLTEQLIEELQSMGLKVLELRAAPDIFIDLRIGELGLTREMSQVVNNQKADALVVGTYTRAGDKVVVNSRMIVKKTQEVVGVGSMVVDAGDKNKFVAALLKNEVTTVMPTETVEGF